MTDFRDHRSTERRASPTKTEDHPSLRPCASAETLDRLASPFSFGRTEHRSHTVAHRSAPPSFHHRRDKTCTAAVTNQHHCTKQDDPTRPTHPTAGPPRLTLQPRTCRAPRPHCPSSLRSPINRSPNNPGILQSRDDFRDHHRSTERRASPTRTEDHPSPRSLISRSPTNPGILQGRDGLARRASLTRTG